MNLLNKCLVVLATTVWLFPLLIALNDMAR